MLRTKDACFIKTVGRAGCISVVHYPAADSAVTRKETLAYKSVF